MELDQIKIEGLEIFANHGVFPEENVLGQKFIVSATLYTDTRKAGKTDELTASIHYGICKITYIQITGARGRRTGRRYASEV